MKEKLMCAGMDHVDTCSGLYKVDVEEVFWIKGQHKNNRKSHLDINTTYQDMTSPVCPASGSSRQAHLFLSVFMYCMYVIFRSFPVCKRVSEVFVVIMYCVFECCVSYLRSPLYLCTSVQITRRQTNQLEHS